jgi:hypothetical protein
MSRPLRMEYTGALYHVTSRKRQALIPFAFFYKSYGNPCHKMPYMKRVRISVSLLLELISLWAKFKGHNICYGQSLLSLHKLFN